MQGSEDKATIEQQKAEIERLNKKVNSKVIVVLIKSKKNSFQINVKAFLANINKKNIDITIF